MKKLKSWMMIAALGLSLMLSGCSEKAAEGPRIGVIQLMEHTSLNMIYDSLKEELETLGYQDGENCTIVFKNAQGEQSNIGSCPRSSRRSWTSWWRSRRRPRSLRPSWRKRRR